MSPWRRIFLSAFALQQYHTSSSKVFQKIMLADLSVLSSNGGNNNIEEIKGRDSIKSLKSSSKSSQSQILKGDTRINYIF